MGERELWMKKWDLGFGVLIRMMWIVEGVGNHERERERRALRMRMRRKGGRDRVDLDSADFKTLIIALVFSVFYFQ